LGEDLHLENLDLGTGTFETGLDLLSELADVTVAGGWGRSRLVETFSMVVREACTHVE